MIKVEGLTKRYGRTVAVDNISFSVEKGQIVGFLGPNGAGKTTTMRVLTCFLPPTAGTAHVAGFDVIEQPLEVKKRIGYLPESPPLSPKWRYRIPDLRRPAQGRTQIGYREPRGRSMRPLRDGDIQAKLISQLSKGYRQRVGLAQAIIHNPDVLILDEPTAGLDPKQIIETRELIKNLAKAGAHTIILSTHILPEVEQTCERVAHHQQGATGGDRYSRQPDAPAARRPESVGGREWKRGTGALDAARGAARPGAGRRGQHAWCTRDSQGQTEAMFVVESLAGKARHPRRPGPGGGRRQAGI